MVIVTERKTMLPVEVRRGAKWIAVAIEEEANFLELKRVVFLWTEELENNATFANGFRLSQSKQPRDNDDKA